jgi:hypothetical protein
MDKIYLKIMLAQASVDILFNAYNRSKAFNLSDDDIIDFLDHFEKILCDIQREIVASKLVRPELFSMLRDEWPIESRLS